jgi:hypothetical protein
LSVVTPSTWGLGWTDPNTTETGYAIERLLPTSGWERLGMTGSDQSGWQHTAADYQTSMTYRVVALGAGGLEAASPSISLPDTDGDGIPNALELGEGYAGVSGTYASDPDQFSTNGSGVGDGWLARYGINPATTTSVTDTDNDGLTDAAEYAAGTSPTNPDTDGDGLSDGREVAAGRNPTAKDEPLHVLIEFPVNLRPADLSKNGTVLLHTIDTAPQALYRWNAGVLTSLNFPPLLADEEFGSLYALQLNSLGAVAVNLSRGHNLSILVWPSNSNDFIELDSPVYLVQRDYESYYSKSARLSFLNAQNHVWAEVAYNRFASSDLAKWTSFTDPPIFLGGKYFSTPNLIALGVNDSGTLISYKKNPDATGSHQVGSTPVPFQTRAINSSGWVLGSSINFGGNPLLYKDSLTVNLPNWNLTGIDDDNNLYGVTSGGRKAMWTKDKETLISVPSSATAYEPIEYVPVIVPAGWSSNHEVIHGSHSPQLGIGQFTNPAVPGSIAQTKPFLLIPAEIAVDNNRDGKIKLRRERYIATEDDTTSQQAPFCFWSNDDDDVNTENLDNVEKTTVSRADWEDDKIDGVRDLEDFARLNIYMGGLQDAIVAGTIKVGLKWKNVTSGAPAVKVWCNLSPNGGTEYLTDLTVAQQHLTLTQPGYVHGTDTYIIPTQFWTANALSATQPNGYMLFEGCGVGKGQLVITIHKADGTEIGEGPGVYMDLNNIKAFYQRVKVTPRSPSPMPSPFLQSSMAFPERSTFDASTAGTEPSDDGVPFVAPTKEDKTALVFVHGSNIPYEEARWNAETMFKRLYWQGYKGRFVLFYWDTLVGLWDGEFPAHYNHNEYRGWKYGPALSGYVASGLPSGYAKNVIGHSLGNGLILSALKG